MKSPLAQNTAKSAKALAQTIAKQIAREPLEVLKTAKEQTSGEEIASRPERRPVEQTDEQKKLVEHQQELQDKMKASRRMEALNRELGDIHTRKIFEDVQRKIAAGEEVALEEYPELSPEQKQVLKAQMEAIKIQSAKAKSENAGLQEPTTKPSRRFGLTRKQEAEKQQTRVEKPVPPSG